MIIAVNEYYHDYGVEKYFIDTEKLESSNPIDDLILKKCKNKSKQLQVTYEAGDWEENPLWVGSPDDKGIYIGGYGQPCITPTAVMKKTDIIDKTLILRITFE